MRIYEQLFIAKPDAPDEEVDAFDLAASGYVDEVDRSELGNAESILGRPANS